MRLSTAAIKGSSILKIKRSRFSGERGSVINEYAIMLALLTVALSGQITNVRTQIEDVYLQAAASQSAQAASQANSPRVGTSGPNSDEYNAGGSSTSMPDVTGPTPKNEGRPDDINDGNHRGPVYY